MKKYIAFLLMFVPSVAFADSKLTALTQDTTAQATDLLYKVDTPAGTPTSRSVAVGDLLNSVASSSFSALITLQGNLFNTAGKLTQLDAAGSLNLPSPASIYGTIFLSSDTSSDSSPIIRSVLSNAIWSTPQHLWDVYNGPAGSESLIGSVAWRVSTPKALVILDASGNVKHSFDTSGLLTSTNIAITGLSPGVAHIVAGSSNVAVFQVSLSTEVSGTLPDTNLSSNVAFLNSTQTFSAKQTFTKEVVISTSISGISRIQWSDGTVQVSSPPAGGAGSASDFLSTLVSAETTIGSTVTLSSSFDKMYVATATTNDYTITLPDPSGNAGKFIGIRIRSDATKFITVSTSTSGGSIDGQPSRIMWAGESATLMSDGTNWTKVAGKTIPMIAQGAQQQNQTIPTATVTLITLSSNVVDNTGSMVDLTNDVLIVRRPGIYSVEGTIIVNFAAPSGNTQVLVMKNGSSVTPIAINLQSSPAGLAGPTVLGPISFVKGDTLDLRFYQASGLDAPLILGVSPEYTTYISAVETPTW